MASYLIATVVTAVVGGAVGAFVADGNVAVFNAADPVAAWTEIARVQADADGGRLDCLKDDKAEWQKFVFSDFAQRTITLRNEALGAGLDREAAKRVEDAYSERLAAGPGSCDPAKVDQNEAKALELRRAINGSSVEG